LATIVLRQLPTVETIGYIGRAISAKQTPNWALGPYIIQSTFLLVAPAFFAASIYMELGRIIKLVQGERHSLISVNAMTKIFVSGDILSFLTQASWYLVLYRHRVDRSSRVND
jgi:hypothetical protein